MDVNSHLFLGSYSVIIMNYYFWQAKNSTNKRMIFKVVQTSEDRSSIYYKAVQGVDKLNLLYLMRAYVCQGLLNSVRCQQHVWMATEQQLFHHMHSSIIEQMRRQPKMLMPCILKRVVA